MLDSLKRTLLSALKTVALTPDDIRHVVDDFVARGDLSQDLGKKVIDALLERAKEGEESKERLGKEVGKLTDILPFASRNDLRDLAGRVRRLEERLGAVPPAPDEVAAPPPPGEQA